MAGHRIDRIESDIQRVLPSILRELKDPRITGMLSIVRVEVTNDLSYATIYVSSMDGKEAADEAVEGLKHASGFIRNAINKEVKMRKSPELRFVADDSIEYSVEMIEKLKKLNEKENAKTEEESKDEE